MASLFQTKIMYYTLLKSRELEESLFLQNVLFSLLFFAAYRFANFQDTAMTDSVLVHVIAVLVLFATIKLWRLLRLNPKLNLITASLQRAWTDISGFLMVMAIMCVAYSVAVSLCIILFSLKVL